jgi:putative phosphoesterase
MVRLGIISDVHGNAAALRAALAALDRLPGVDAVCSLGDAIAIGPDTNEVLALLRSRPDVTALRGNHEDAVLAVRDGRDPGSRGDEREHHAWTAARLDRAHEVWLRLLPRRLLVERAGARILLLHYHLDASGSYLPVEQSPGAAALDALYRGAPADAVCHGHHHEPRALRGERRLYVNPGALGTGDRPVARYAVLSIGTAGEVDVTLHEEAYDNRAFLASFQRLQVPARAFILSAFYGNQHLRGPIA